MNGEQTSWRSLMLADEVAVSGGIPFPCTADQYFKDDVADVGFDTLYESFCKQADEPSSAASVNIRCLLVRKLSDALREACEFEKQTTNVGSLPDLPDNHQQKKCQSLNEEVYKSSRCVADKVNFLIGDNGDSDTVSADSANSSSTITPRRGPLNSVELVELFFHLSADEDSAVRAESLDSLPSFLDAFERGWPQIDSTLQRRGDRKLNMNGYHRMLVDSGEAVDRERGNSRVGSQNGEDLARLGSGALFVPIVVHGVRDELNEQVRKNALAALERIAEQHLFPSCCPPVERQLLDTLVEPLRRRNVFELPPACASAIGSRRMSSRSSPTLASAIDYDESIRIGSLKLIGKLAECGLVSNSALRRHFEEPFKRACADPSVAIRRQCAALFSVFSCLLDTSDQANVNISVNTNSSAEVDVDGDAENHSEDDVFGNDAGAERNGCDVRRRNASSRLRKTESSKSICDSVQNNGVGHGGSLLDSFLALCSDSSVQVRRECAVAFVAVAQRVAIRLRRTRLTRAFVRLLDDTAAYNRCVQQAAYTHLGSFISMMTDADINSDIAAETDCEKMTESEVEKTRASEPWAEGQSQGRPFMTSNVDPTVLMLLLSATDERAFESLAHRLQINNKVRGFELLPGNDDWGDPFSSASTSVDAWSNTVSSHSPSPTIRSSQNGSPHHRARRHFLFDLVRYEQLRTCLCLPPPFTLAEVFNAAGPEHERVLNQLLTHAARFSLLSESAIDGDAVSSNANQQPFDCVPADDANNAGTLTETETENENEADQCQSVPVTFDLPQGAESADSAMRELQGNGDFDTDGDATQQLNITSTQVQHPVTFEQRFKAILQCLLSDASFADTDTDSDAAVIEARETDFGERYSLINGVPRILIEYFVSMLDAERNESSANNPAESDPIRYCAETLPCVVRTLTAPTRKQRAAAIGGAWPRCRLLLFALACSANWRVRRTVAQSLAELARFIGQSYASCDLLAVFAEFVRENLDEVKAGLADCLAGLVRLVTPAARRDLLARVAHLFTQENARNWRVRRDLLAQLSRLAADGLLPLAAFSDLPSTDADVDSEASFRFVDVNFSPLQLLRDPVYEVRVAAFHLLATVLELAAPADASEEKLSDEHCYTAVLRSAQSLVFEQQNQATGGEQRLNSSYRDRQCYVQLMGVVCDRAVLLTPSRAHLVDQLLSPALALANDRIVNVRISLANLLSNANLLNFFSASGNCVYPEALLASYRTLLADTSIDVHDLVASAIASHPGLLAALAFAADH